jgi:hypothetical protein
MLKRKVLGGPQALQTSRLASDCVTPVTNNTNTDLPAIPRRWYNAPHIEPNRVLQRMNMYCGMRATYTLDEDYV